MFLQGSLLSTAPKFSPVCGNNFIALMVFISCFFVVFYRKNSARAQDRIPLPVACRIMRVMDGSCIPAHVQCSEGEKVQKGVSSLKG